MTRPIRLTLAVLAWLVIGLLTVLVIRADAAPACENVPGFVVVQAASLRVRSGPGTTYDTLRFVGRDDILPVLDAEAMSNWWRVCPEGFVGAAFVRFEAAATPTPTPTPTATARPVVIVTQTPRATPTRLAVQLVYCASLPTVTEVEPGLWRVTCEYRR